MPSLGRQGALCKLVSLTSLTLFPLHHDRTTTRIVRKAHSITGELWFEEEKLGLYLISRTTCKVGLSCTEIFSLV